MIPVIRSIEVVKLLAIESKMVVASEGVGRSSSRGTALVLQEKKVLEILLYNNGHITNTTVLYA